MCVCHRSKKHFLYFFTFAFNVERTWPWSGSKVKKHCFLPGSKIKKTFSMIFYFRANQCKKHGLGRDQSEKNIVCFRVQRSKKHFLWFFYFGANKFDQSFLGLRNRNLSVVFLKLVSLTFIASKGLFLKVRYVPETTRMMQSWNRSKFFGPDRTGRYRPVHILDWTGERPAKYRSVQILNLTGEKSVAHNSWFNWRKTSALHVSIYQSVLSWNSLSFQFYRDIKYWTHIILEASNN